MRQRARHALAATLGTASLTAGMVLGAAPAIAEPDPPVPPADPAVVAAEPAEPAPPRNYPFNDDDPRAQAIQVVQPPPPMFPWDKPQPLQVPPNTPAGQNPLPFEGTPPFRPPTFNPVNGSMVGVAKPIYINFAVPIKDRAMAEQAIHISSVPPVPGRFYWVTDTQLRWRPQDFWPSNTTVTIDAAGTKSSFRTGDYLVATIDDNSKQMEIMRNGKLEETFPVSMGRPDGKHETKNGTYYVLEKFPDIVMDSSTYGVPVDSAEGYKLKVQDAVRIDNSGVFVHSAPWSVGAQGERNVSHGCINLSPENAQWFYDNFGSGDPVVIKGTGGGWYDTPDGASDWQMF
jgi:lipoprotein-anchoring transpeptidase ErfK/SrfK